MTISTSKPVILCSFKISVQLKLTPDQKSFARTLINQHYLNDQVGLIEQDGVLVSKHPDRETPEYLLAQRTLHDPMDVDVNVSLLSDGSLRLVG